MARQRPMTVAVLGTRGFPGVQGGVERHCRELYTRLPECRFRVYRRKPYLTEASAAEFDNIEFVDWPSTRVRGLEAVLHTVCAVVHCLLRRPDLAHVHNMGPAALALPLRLAGIPVVMTYHSVNHEHAKWGRCARWLLRRSESLSLRHCDRVIFVNRDRMMRLEPEVRRKSVYIPNGVAPAEATGATGFLRRHGIVPGGYVLAVGRLTPEKGLEHLIEAAGRSPVVTQVVIAGAGDHGDSYCRRLRRLDAGRKVIFTGYAGGDDLRQLYSHARLFVLPSLSEGAPLAVLEAMSFGLPVVCSDLPATRQTPLPEESYCPPGDTEALREAIECRLARPAARVSYDLAAHDWRQIAGRTREVFQDALGQKRRGLNDDSAKSGPLKLKKNKCSLTSNP